MEYPETEEFRNIMIQLMNRSKSGEDEMTMKIQRPIGFRGKTRIVGILDPEKQKVLYRGQNINIDLTKIFHQL